IRRNPVGDDRPLRAVPLLELDAPAPLMIAAGEGKRRDQALCPKLLDIGWRDGEVFQPPLHLRSRQRLIPEFSHGPTDRLRGEKARQHAPEPVRGTDITFRTRSFASGIDIFEHILDEREVSPRAMKVRTDVANSRLAGRHRVLLRAGPPIPHDLVTREADL